MSDHRHQPVLVTDPEYLGVGALIRVCEICGTHMMRGTR